LSESGGPRREGRRNENGAAPDGRLKMWIVVVVD
jgi:hypothetical protein